MSFEMVAQGFKFKSGLYEKSLKIDDTKKSVRIRSSIYKDMRLNPTNSTENKNGTVLTIQS